MTGFTKSHRTTMLYTLLEREHTLLTRIRELDGERYMTKNEKHKFVNDKRLWKYEFDEWFHEICPKRI